RRARIVAIDDDRLHAACEMRETLTTAHHGDHLGSRVPRELARDAADRARGAGDQHALTGAHRADFVQRNPCRRAWREERGADVESHVVGQHAENFVGHHAAFAPAAVAARAETTAAEPDARAGSEARAALDHAAALDAGHVR